MVSVDDVIDKTDEMNAKKQKGKEVLKLTKDFFKFPYVVGGTFPYSYIPVRKFISVFGKNIIGIWPELDSLICYDEKSFKKFMDFAKLYEEKIMVPKLQIDYSEKE